MESYRAIESVTKKACICICSLRLQCGELDSYLVQSNQAMGTTYYADFLVEVSQVSSLLESLAELLCEELREQLRSVLPWKPERKRQILGRKDWVTIRSGIQGFNVALLQLAFETEKDCEQALSFESMIAGERFAVLSLGTRDSELGDPIIQEALTRVASKTDVSLLWLDFRDDDARVLFPEKRTVSIPWEKEEFNMAVYKDYLLYDVDAYVEETLMEMGLSIKKV